MIDKEIIFIHPLLLEPTFMGRSTLDRKDYS